MSIDNNALEKEQGGVIKEFIHWENISEGNRKCLDQIREHFKLTSDFEAICLAIQKLMPALHQVDNLRTNLVALQNLLEQKNTVLEKVRDQLEQMIGEV